MTQSGWTPEEMAALVAADLEDGSYVNLGIGLPTLVASYIPPGREIVFHSENGIVGMGPRAKPGEEDPDVVDAGKNPVTLALGAAIVHHADSFTIIRARRIPRSCRGRRSAPIDSIACIG